MALNKSLIVLSFLAFNTYCIEAQSIKQLNKDSLYQLGKYYYNQSELVFEKSLDSCLHYTILAKDLFLAAEKWESYIDMISGMAGVYYYKGDFPQALLYNNQALQASEEYLGKQSKSYGFALNTKGLLLARKGDNQGAIACLLEALEIAKKNPNDKINLAVALHNLALRYAQMGDYKQAIFYFQETLKTRMEVLEPNDTKIAITHLAIGNCHRSINQLDQAKKYYHKALQILTIKPHNKIVRNRSIEIYNGFADIFLQQEKLDSAIIFARKVLAIQKQETNFFNEYLPYQILGKIRLKEKDYKSALQYFQKAVSLVNKHYQNVRRHPTKAQALAYVADTYQKMGKLDAALNLYQQASVLGSTMPDTNNLSVNPTAVQQLSKIQGLKILRAKGKALHTRFVSNQQKEGLQNALRCYQAINKLIHDLRRSFLADDSKLFLAATSAEIYEEAIQIALTLNRIQPEKKFLEYAFAFAEGNKANLQLEALKENLAQGARLLPNSLIQKEYQLEVDIAFYKRKIAEEKLDSINGSLDKISIWERKLFQLQDQYNLLLRSIEQQYPKFYNLKYQVHSIDIKAYQKSLVMNRSLLIEYFIGKEKVYIFSLNQNKLEVHEIEDKNSIVQDIYTLREVIAKPPTSDNFIPNCQRFGQVAWQLYKKLLQKPLANQKANVDNLIIVPDGIISFLPFEVLITKAASPRVQGYKLNSFAYLIKKWNINYTHSIRVSSLLKRYYPTVELQTFLGIAPTFNEVTSDTRNCENGKIYNLACNKVEVENINKRLRGNKAFDEHATKEYFIKQAPNYKIIHLATHACINDNNPMLNKIFFSNGSLSAYDLSALNLNAELVVLSACNTGTGKLLEGEGIFSLARNFFITGCKSNLTSLWSVDDCATAQIMNNFYAELQQGKAKDEAIRNAKLSFLKTADQENSHPYYWAAFIQFGNTSTIKINTHRFPLHIYGFIALLLSTLLFSVYKIKKRNR